MTKDNNEFKIIIIIPELGYEITDSEIDYKIYKTDNNSPDYALLNIWNLDNYKQLLLKGSKVNIYTKYLKEDLKLLFNGYITELKTLKGVPLYVNPSSGKISNDVLSKVKIVNSNKQFQKFYINKTYREPVSSTQIINDCVEVMGIKSVIFSETISEKLYPVYKAVGKPYSIIKRICKSLNCNCLIQDEILYLNTPADNARYPNLLELNSVNSLEPEYKNETERCIITRLKSVINPYDFVICKFHELEGIYNVSEVESDGNNYNTEGTTTITIRLN